jgi:DNA polymerase III epsilon subunit-like protein
MDDSKDLVILNDFESTGLDERKHEIIDVGVRLIHGPTLELIAADSFRVRPERMHLADPGALKINGYNEEGWRGALSKKDAMDRYLTFISGALDFASWNAWFDRRLFRAWERDLNIEVPLDYHVTDIVMLAKEKLWWPVRKVERISLNTVAEYLGLGREPDIHTGENGAAKAHEVWKALRTL